MHTYVRRRRGALTLSPPARARFSPEERAKTTRLAKTKQNTLSSSSSSSSSEREEIRSSRFDKTLPGDELAAVGGGAEGVEVAGALDTALLDLGRAEGEAREGLDLCPNDRVRVGVDSCRSESMIGRARTRTRPRGFSATLIDRCRIGETVETRDLRDSSPERHAILSLDAGSDARAFHLALLVLRANLQQRRVVRDLLQLRHDLRASSLGGRRLVSFKRERERERERDDDDDADFFPPLERERERERKDAQTRVFFRERGIDPEREKGQKRVWREFSS